MLLPDPPKELHQGSYSWGFSPQHSPCAMRRQDGGLQITVTVSLSYRAPLPPELVSPTAKYLIGFNIFISPIFHPQAKIPAGFISTMRKPHSSCFTLKLDVEPQNKILLRKKQNKQKRNKPKKTPTEPALTMQINTHY